MSTFIPYDLKELDDVQVRDQSTLSAAKRLKTFNKFAHKGTRGHAVILAGSEGMMGAALLATRAAAKSGAGKVTAVVPERYFGLFHLAVPEALLKNNTTEEANLAVFDAVGIGPGMGINTLTLRWLEAVGRSSKPAVIDADALNLIAQDLRLMEALPPNAILTPHLLEWERLFGTADNDRHRIEKTIEVCARFKINMILKGHFSCLITKNKELFINGTGNAGMGKGGSGDVLTGLLAGLLAQGYEAEHAAILGMYLHGLAGDIARDRLGEETMTASDIIDGFSAAFHFLRKSTFSP